MESLKFEIEEKPYVRLQNWFGKFGNEFKFEMMITCGVSEADKIFLGKILERKETIERFRGLKDLGAGLV